ncbi:lactococcin 972 family bacteriocin [Streptomyces sp. ID05-47C]|uniref:lactococcin 972 family bacteriocin n=1 Tax=Streptomyces sp. ID05-47C TaxID=3028665 RepID=UPI0029BD9684|nr:lactococcin 972 family bacteriocin [Streptomyces sp. ID05-47C]MDX3574395.1 lactococcin 972 family bacteriocin [Streptomyces sp. ID05-47C]
MKVIGRSIAIMAAGAAMATGILASPASAAAPQPPKELGNVSEWGMVAIEVDPSSDVTAQTTDDVGGGTWTYGTEITTAGKRCYSYYFHGSKDHKATAKIAGSSYTDTALAGTSAKASKTAGTAYTCYTYWGLLE